MNSELANKVALITGGSRGIGRAIALAFAETGMQIAFCGRTQESLDATAEAIHKLGARAFPFRTDVSCVKELELLVANVISKTKRLDILINNAVTSESAPFESLSDEMFQYHIDVKLMAYIRLARLTLPYMKTKKWGRIINIGGMTARVVAPFRMTNGVVNAGVANFTKQFSNYAAEHQVTVNCVHPGYTLTERVNEIFVREAKENGVDVASVIQRRTEEIPLGRLVKPEDIASAVLFFCSPLANMITGQCLAVDGGSGDAIIY